MNHTLRQHQILHPNTKRDEHNSERSIDRRPNTPSRGGNRRVLPRQLFAAHRPIPARIAVLIYAIDLACAIALVVLP